MLEHGDQRDLGSSKVPRTMKPVRHGRVDTGRMIVLAVGGQAAHRIEMTARTHDRGGTGVSCSM